VAQGQALANKLFNAARFALTRIVASLGEERARALVAEAQPQAIEDRWILSRLARAIEQTTGRIETYDFSKAALGLYDFVYAELCDWYVELVKHRLTSAGEDGAPAPVHEREGLAATLLYVLRNTVALAHPLIPFVTEELWGYIDGAGTLLAGAEYPDTRPEHIDTEAEDALGRLIEAVTLVRGWRDTVSASPGLVLPARLQAQGYEHTREALQRLGRLDLDAGAREDGRLAASIAVSGGTIELLHAQGLDLDAAQRRREAARARLEQEISRARTKLENDAFVGGAPAEIVERERDKLARLSAELETL
jgi:valyl-tRNA synthetase